DSCVLVRTQSDDWGSNWQPLSPIHAPTLSSHRIPALALLRTPGGFEIVYSQDGDIQLLQERGGGWAEFKVRDARPGEAPFEVETSIDAAQEGPTSVLAWTDERHRWFFWSWKGFLMNPLDALLSFTFEASYSNNDIYVMAG